MLNIRRLSPEKSPIMIRKYTKSPDIIRRPGMHRSPDPRIRGALDSIPSLPQLKERSPESSAEDLQTPKQSPERDSEQMEDSFEEEVKMLEVGGPSDESSCSPTSLKSLSQEESPGSQKLPKHDRDQSDELKEAPSLHQELEASYDRTSKFSEDTLSNHSNELPPPHSKSPSDSDVGGGGGGGTASISHSTRDLALSSSTSLSVTSLATHSKAASDDATAMRSSIRSVSASSKTSSKSLNEINTLEVRSGDVSEALKISTLVENRVESKQRLDADTPQPSKAKLELSSSILVANGDGKDRSMEDLESTIVPSASQQASLDDTVISPTLRLKPEEPQAGKDQEEMNVGAEIPPMGEDALFDMLGEGGEERKRVSSAEEGVSSSGEGNEMTQPLGKDLNTLEEGEEIKPEDVLDEFDKILDLKEISVSSSTANVEEGDVPASPAGAVEDSPAQVAAEAKRQPIAADEGKRISPPPQVLPCTDSNKSPTPHPDLLEELEENMEPGPGKDTVISLTKADEDKEKSADLDPGENQTNADSSLEIKIDPAEQHQGVGETEPQAAGAAALELSTDCVDSVELNSKESPERTFGPNNSFGKASSAEYTPSPDHMAVIKSQEVELGSMEELPCSLGASSEVEVETKEEGMEGESQGRVGERQLSEDVDDHSRQMSEDPQDQER